MKKLIFKIILSLLLLASIVGLTYIGVTHSKDAIICLKNSGVYPKELGLKFVTFSLICFLSATIELIIFIVILVKGLPYLFNSAYSEYQSHKKSVSKARKQKKIEELEKQLNDLKKDK